MSPDHRVLEIGTGSGYQAAVLAELARQVYSIELLPGLAERARGVLQGLGYANVEIKVGDGYKGWPEQAPFDRIIVTAAPEEVPRALVDQLADGGRMVVPVGGAEQSIRVITRRGAKVDERVTIPVRFVPMVRPPR
jgi:protein-L-isoaspartate(D-aspartate) O-methyltransferase